MNDSKNCTKCSTVKPFEDFYKDKTARLGLSAYCKSCMKAKSKSHREANPRRKKDLDLRYKFNITIEEFDAMLTAQGGVCAICGTDEPGGKGGAYFAVDHNHETGEVRGLLCNRCNRAIGMLDEDPNVLRSAIEYLNKYS